MDHPDPLNLAGKTVVVTGGNGGIGQGIVEVFSERDANVVIADRAPALKAQETRGRGHILDLRTDVTDRASIDAMVKQTIAEFGRIDILINNAGRGAGIANLPILSSEDMDWMTKLNILGTVHTTQAVAAQMVEAGGGNIVCISSAAAVSGLAGRTDPFYAGCKGFIQSFTRAVAADLGPKGIRCNLVAPGWIVPESDEKTSTGSFWNTLEMFGTPSSFNAEYERTGEAHNLGFQPIQDLGRPRDIAYACLFFASDASRYLTGQLLCVNGGGHMPA